MILKMRLFFIAYHYTPTEEVELIDGPYGTLSEALIELDSLKSAGGEDSNLKIVSKRMEVTEV